MNCNQVEQYISDIVDNELSGEREREIKEHLEQCKKCERLYRIEISTKKLVGAVTTTVAPLGLRDRILASISGPVGPAEDCERPGGPFSSILSFLSRRSVVLSTAAAAVIVIGLISFVLFYFGGLKMSPFIDTVYAYHVNSADSTTIQGTCEEIEEVLAKNLSSHTKNAVLVPSLEDMDLVLRGANNDIRAEGRHCAVVRYEGHGAEFSHFIICCTAVPIEKLLKVKGSDKFRYVSRNGINIVFWRCGVTETTRCIASGDSVEKIVEIAEEFISRSMERRKAIGPC